MNDQITDRTVSILERLVAFNTTSHRSNLDLITDVEAELTAHGIASRRIGDSSSGKVSLIATIGPAAPGGVVLSGHTDVVPVDGQDWTSDPFRLTRVGDRLVGRGVADMKGFVACALAAIPMFQATGLRRPVHLALSYDEEVGCLGAHDLADAVLSACDRPSAVIVGEPTLMAVVESHKGASVHEVVVRGMAGHSSAPHLGASAIMHAIPLLNELYRIADDLEWHGARHDGFDPPVSTLTVGRIEGGTAVNILAEECRFFFDLRCLPGIDPNAVLAPFHAAAAIANAALRKARPDAGVIVRRLADVAALADETDGAAAALATRLTGDNRRGRCVSYGSEGGIFQRRGLSTVICGPGSIEQAHKADEFIDLDQLRRCTVFLQRLAAELAR